MNIKAILSGLIFIPFLGICQVTSQTTGPGNTPIISAGGPWFIDGNSNTNPSIDFLGTINNRDLVFRTTNIPRMIIGATGNIHIGSSLPQNQDIILDIEQGNRWQGIRFNGNSGASVAFEVAFPNSPTYSRFKTYADGHTLIGQFPSIPGINGTYNPADPMLIVGQSQSYPNSKVINAVRIGGSSGPVDLFGVYANGLVQIGDGNGSLYQGTQGMIMKFSSGDRAIMELHTPDGPSQNKLVIQSHTSGSHIWSANGKNLFLQYGGGAVLIGPRTSIAHNNARLGVDGMIVCQELFVTAINDWADYVFAEDYKIPNLYDIEKFYVANKHLPEIPSENEIKENGLNMSEMSKLLLKKIEEMTILMVQQQKEIDALKKNR
jgi:hypothetical protein